jgi:pyruvate,orthophosphate dikinase
MKNRLMKVGDLVIKEGDWISIDGTVGEVFQGQLETMVPDIKDPWLLKLLSWADDCRRLGVWANADYPQDARRAREYGAEGIGLCRTEHMFFETERLPHIQKMIMTDSADERAQALEALLPYQREDFAGLFRAMDGLPVIIRLIDPPLHEFLPAPIDLMRELTDLKLGLQKAAKNTIQRRSAASRRKFTRGQSHARFAGRTAGYSHSGIDHHAGAGHF